MKKRAKSLMVIIPLASLLFFGSSCDRQHNIKDQGQTRDLKALSALSLVGGEFTTSDRQPSISELAVTDHRAYSNDKFFAYIDSDTDVIQMIEAKDDSFAVPDAKMGDDQFVSLAEDLYIASIPEPSVSHVIRTVIESDIDQPLKNVRLIEYYEDLPTGAEGSYTFKLDGLLFMGVIRDQQIDDSVLEKISEDYLSSEEAVTVAESAVESYPVLTDYDWEVLPLEKEPIMIVQRNRLCWDIEIPISIHDEGLEGTSQAVSPLIDIQTGEVLMITSTLN